MSTYLSQGEYLMIEQLHIENFRCFKSADVGELRPINIIVGNNASGKTAFLESIKLGLDAFPNLLPWFNQLRSIPSAYPGNPSQEQFQSLFLDLFHQFDSETDVVTSIKDSKNRTATLRLHFDPSRATTIQLPLGFQPPTPQSLPTTIVPLAFDRVDFDGRSDTLLATLTPQGGPHFDQGKPMGIVSGLIGSAHFGIPFENATWLSQLRIEKHDDEIIQAIKRHFPLISNVSVESPLPGMAAVYVDLATVSRKLPLSIVSGGISRLFTLMLAIVAFKEGVVLVDEIENGIFYERYPLMWKTLADLVKHHKTQLFVSTHSGECLKAALPVIKKSPDDFSMLRVRRENGHSIIERFGGEQVAAALEKDGELRE